MKQRYSLNELQNINIPIQKPFLIFLYGDLWAGKTTLSSIIIQRLITKADNINSPTYVYYNKYKDIYHFDLYRLQDYDEFISIWGEEILDNNEGIILVEWPELLEPYYIPDLKITIDKTQKEGFRDIELIYKKEL